MKRIGILAALLLSCAAARAYAAGEASTIARLARAFQTAQSLEALASVVDCGGYSGSILFNIDSHGLNISCVGQAVHARVNIPARDLSAQGFMIHNVQGDLKESLPVSHLEYKIGNAKTVDAGEGQSLVDRFDRMEPGQAKIYTRPWWSPWYLGEELGAVVGAVPSRGR